MSVKHPIIAITGSSGAGTTTTTNAIRHIFRNLNIDAAYVGGDSFHRFTRPEMEVEIRKAQEQGRHISYFGPKANDFALLETLFQQYGDDGSGKFRQYLHTFDDAVPFNQMPGTFTPWQELPANTDLLFYEGLHGGVKTEDIDVAKHVDLLVGMVPIVNLEWIQKIVRDTTDRGHSREAVMSSIVRGLDDYFHYITPQFSRTHVNFQRVPTVDTSNPFSAREIPTQDESFVVVRFRREMKNVNFPYLLQMIDGSFMSRINTLVVPGGKMGLAMELILTPLIEDLMKRKQKRGYQMDWVQ
ncbi:MAG: phosphoribulokinase [Pseudomonadota bacterium]|mgnify:FL=1|jgi:phosphoribulokinase|uniref:Phosphoribulokinase n=1 Tax=Marisediminitalea aggregata TaxID=634436 RepID=A0A1M5F9Q0_9ALTE|nr:phosphoribulokinase [Marisediminitalea aggregata]MAH56400.1 phosphoribulokinase [Aestuariibacter sp.]MAP19742.1 phosphoribulokinase [Alteromonadaceae bacterium]MCP3689604.1 phosphoribulokinase [Gammaproteobacteria bacterium]MEC7825279.1 phosphoribulokinase [Pseudomonadota bacterium]BBO29882.1 phosphoribulokinase [Alteromonas sp. I4]HBY40502.1 phosphoribulokinase [Alteromonas sp.]|tara:strand:+ start:58968 stop:59864 length:897 start_codon:yes stop_codon:yes gene_type:complete